MRNQIIISEEERDTLIGNDGEGTLEWVHIRKDSVEW